jgi:hypothetical protein
VSVPLVIQKGKRSPKISKTHHDSGPQLRPEMHNHSPSERKGDLSEMLRLEPPGPAKRMLGYKGVIGITGVDEIGTYARVQHFLDLLDRLAYHIGGGAGS